MKRGGTGLFLRTSEEPFRVGRGLTRSQTPTRVPRRHKLHPSLITYPEVEGDSEMPRTIGTEVPIPATVGYAGNPCAAIPIPRSSWIAVKRWIGGIAGLWLGLRLVRVVAWRCVRIAGYDRERRPIRYVVWHWNDSHDLNLNLRRCGLRRCSDKREWLVIGGRS